MMTARELIDFWIARLEADQQRLIETGSDAPVHATQGRLVQTIGNLSLYECLLPPDVVLPTDLPLSVIPPNEAEATEGYVLRQTGQVVLVQLMDALGTEVSSATFVPDRAGLLELSVNRLKDLLANPDQYHLGPAERLASLLQVDGERFSSASSVLTGLWGDDRSQRRLKLASLVMDGIRANKRMLLISPDHQECDEVTGLIARTMKAGGLNHKTWISRYELPIAQQSSGINLQELGFEAQMHQFYAKSQADKASLRRKYERFRELTPFLAQKEAKQKDLDEVRLLEWRLVTHVRDLQVKMADVVSTLKDFETLPLLQRLSLQAVGKNAQSLEQYRVLYQRQLDQLSQELDVAKARIQQMAPEAAVPRGMRAEFDELRDEMARLEGTKKVRELLAAEEDPNRQAFIQNRRLVATTPTRVASDPLFSRVRFDVLMVDEAPRITPAALLAAAGLVRERVVISGDPQEIATAGCWRTKASAVHTTS